MLYLCFHLASLILCFQSIFYRALHKNFSYVAQCVVLWLRKREGYLISMSSCMLMIGKENKSPSVLVMVAENAVHFDHHRDEVISVDHKLVVVVVLVVGVQQLAEVMVIDLFVDHSISSIDPYQSGIFRALVYVLNNHVREIV